MERLITRSRTFVKALDSLQEAIEKFGNYNDPFSSEYRTYRDSLIQRFEYCTDIFWKFLNAYLRVKMAIVVEIARPKVIFKESSSVGLIDNDELQMCDKLIEDRNLTSHTYHEELAEEIAGKVPGYYELMRTVARRIIE